MTSSSIFQRIAEKDQTAVKDCIEIYGDLIWALAKEFTTSREEAEVATLEIFDDIWQYASRGENLSSSKKVLIASIVWQRLIKYMQ